MRTVDSRVRMRPAVEPGHDGEGRTQASVQTPVPIGVWHRLLTVESRRLVDWIDITVPLTGLVCEVSLENGLVVVQTRHTTTGVMVNEHEPLLLTDFDAMFERLAPPDQRYAHDDFSRRTVNLMPGERQNGQAHCRAALLRSSECLAVVNGALGLGRWQRVFFVELDGGQHREVWVTLVGTTAR